MAHTTLSYKLLHVETKAVIQKLSNTEWNDGPRMESILE